MNSGFLRVADVTTIPSGHMARFNFRGSWVLVANVNGEYFAIADRCSHEDASLFKGALVDDCVRCPLHGSRFNVKTGQPLEEPAEIPVDVYQIFVKEGGIFIGPVSTLKNI